MVVFPYPLNGEEDFIKRVIALPGDRLSIQNGEVFLNGAVLTEFYLELPAQGDMAEILLPDQHVFVMGDNRNDSSDSRIWGPLEVQEIIGKAVFRYWPIADIGAVEHPNLAQITP